MVDVIGAPRWISARFFAEREASASIVVMNQCGSSDLAGSFVMSPTHSVL